MIEAHLAKLRQRHSLSAAEEQVIRDLFTDCRQVPADQTLVRMGEPLNECKLLVDGWLARSRTLADGERQFTELHVAGDFADLHAFTLKRLEHDIITLSPSTIAVTPHERMQQLTEDFPHLTRIYWFQTNLDAAIHREWMVSMGSRDASSKMAHLFCELHIRLDVVGKVTDGSFDFPLTQDEIAACLGLTSVHVNRTLQDLRRQGLVKLEGKKLTILDFDRLKEIGEFDPSYLYLEQRPL